jgi:hypothetical protein
MEVMKMNMGERIELAKNLYLQLAPFSTWWYTKSCVERSEALCFIHQKNLESSQV